MRNFLIKHYIAITAIVAVVVVLGFYFFKFHHQLSDDNGNWGTFGDFFGGTLNPILSFLALMVLLRTFSMQREELDLQREELKETKAILKEQSETQKRQQFESTFFELLKVHNHILDTLSQEPPPTTKNNQGLGISSVQKHNSKLQDVIQPIRYNSLHVLTLANTNEMLSSNNHLCGHYFRTLYQLLKFVAINSDNKINESFKTDDIKQNDVGANEKMYSNMIRALLPDDIMTLLAVNCYCENDKAPYWKFKLLVERYAFFEHASFQLSGRNFDRSDIKKHYNPKAFGK